MFRYRLVRASELPSLAQGKPQAGMLSPREEEILAGLGLLPRRRKWLLGRAAAKRLVREVMGDEAVAENRISVLNRPSGEPFVLIEGKGGWDCPISISHRREIGMAAVPVEKTARIGADLETVEPRDFALVRQFFTDGEAALVNASGADPDLVVARIWSAKEAVLKLLGLGLRLDTRAVVVSLGGESFAGCPDGWQPIGVKVVTEAPQPDWLRDARVVWRREEDCVLTVAVAPS